jgi:Domain of unknown function (DUF4345)
MRSQPVAGRLPLQIAVGVCALVPVGAGVAGVVLGASMAGGSGGPGSDSHVRYLSGLLLGIGLAFWSLVPRIEMQGPAFRLLTALVVLGGLSRLAGVMFVGVPPPAMLFGLAMELVVTPLLCLWQARLEARSGG